MCVCERERERVCDTLTMTSVVHILKKNQPKKSFFAGPGNVDLG